MVGETVTPDVSVEIVTREEHAEAVVIQIGARFLREGAQLVAIRDALFREAATADRTLVVDLAAVEFLTSAAIGWLVTLRRELTRRGRPFNPPCRRRGLFAMFPDRAAALEAIRLGESDPLVLCGAGPGVAEIFVVC